MVQKGARLGMKERSVLNRVSQIPTTRNKKERKRKNIQDATRKRKRKKREYPGPCILLSARSYGSKRPRREGIRMIKGS